MRQARKSGFPDFRKVSVRGFGRMWGFRGRLSDGTNCAYIHYLPK